MSDAARVKAVFTEALDVPEPGRGAFLDRACAGDAVLRSEVEGLLGALSGRPVLDPTTISLVPGDTAQRGPFERAGTLIGRYKLLEAIGEGGFGTVFMAEQEEPVRRRVALKIIKLGMDTRQVIARFEAERQALAIMDHPNIAKVLDAGATDTGRPYFVMELVKGVPITEYCDASHLSATERLELFIPVCHAVQHAHQKGIIHRDIKPSNILVTMHDGRPVPKVIDFGIAKATNARLTEKTLFTEHRQLIGTPAYMSPEQAEMSGLDIDTRTDVYSLGVLLYELLTGTTPFDAKRLREAGYAEIQRIIREVEPEKPSTRISTLGDALSSVAARRQTEPRKLSALVRGDLDWIVMKCLAKDRSRRYETADGLALELGRYLHHEPVLARRPSAAYRMRKFVQRRPGLVASLAAIITLLVGGLAVSLWQRAIAQGQRDRAVAAELAAARDRDTANTERDRAVAAEKAAAENAAKEAQARARAQTINEFVFASLRSGDPYSPSGKQSTTILEAMASAIKDIQSGRFKDDPDTEAALKVTIATIILNNGHTSEALPIFESVLDSTRKRFPGDHRDVSTAMSNVARCLVRLGRSTEALPMHQAAVEMDRRLFPGDHMDVARSLNNLAVCLDHLGRTSEALARHEEALGMWQRLYAGDHTNVAAGLSNVGECLLTLGRPAEALPKYEAALAMNQRMYSGDRPEVARSLKNLAWCLERLGRGAEALPKHEAALEMWQRLYTGDHPDVAQGLNGVAGSLDSLGRFTEALPKHEAALEMWQRLYTGDHPYVAVGLFNVGLCLESLGRREESLTNFQAALAMRQRLFTGDHLDVAISLDAVGRVLVRLERAPEAEPLNIEAVEMLRRLFKGDHPELAKSLMDLSKCRSALGMHDLAVPMAEEADAMARRILPEGHYILRRTTRNLELVRAAAAEAK